MARDIAKNTMGHQHLLPKIYRRNTIFSCLQYQICCTYRNQRADPPKGILWAIGKRSPTSPEPRPHRRNRSHIKRRSFKNWGLGPVQSILGYKKSTEGTLGSSWEGPTKSSTFVSKVLTDSTVPIDRPLVGLGTLITWSTSASDEHDLLSPHSIILHEVLLFGTLSNVHCAFSNAIINERLCATILCTTIFAFGICLQHHA